MFKSLTDCYELSNGVKIPCVGFGMWQTPNGEVAVEAAKAALKAGYRHIDTAQGYGNEGSVGQAIAQSGIPREEIFITSKLNNGVRGYEETIAAFEESCKLLGTDYIDLFLIHWPNPLKWRGNWKHHNAETWRAFEDLYKAGRIRAIGISNFWPRHIEALLETATVVPHVNQCRLCPGETLPEVVEYSREKGILMEAYSPLGTGTVFSVPEMKAIAEKYGKTVAQVCVRWSQQMGFLPLPKSVSEKRIIENADVFDFELSEEDVATIAGLTDCCVDSQISVNPDILPW